MSMLLCPVFPDRKLAFVAIPKNAGTSIRVAFGVAQGFVAEGERVEKPYRKPWPSVDTREEIIALGDAGFTRFCVCRNPWERFASFWLDKGHGNRFLSRSKNPFEEGMGFSRFVETALAIPDHEADRHYRLQTGFIFEGDTLLVDRILRFERLHEDWGELSREFGLPALPHYKKTGASRTYRRLFDDHPDARRLVEERYRRDLEFFGYEY
jgi:hypothetical protein